jgi:hypothetical protein
MPAREVSTHDIVVHAITHGKTVFVPYIYRNQNSQKSVSMMDMLALHSKEDLESLRPDAWGIPTLDEDSVAGRENALSAHRMGISATTDQCTSSGSEVRGLDLILVPGVAFDTRNGRDFMIDICRDTKTLSLQAVIPECPVSVRYGPISDRKSLIVCPQLASPLRNKCFRRARLYLVATTTGRWMK